MPLEPKRSRISGAPVKDDQELDPRITIESKPGIGKDGKEVFLAKEQTKLSSTPSRSIDLSQEISNDSLVALGCDEQLAADLAKERSLKIGKIPNPAENPDLNREGRLILKAKTIVLCGNMGDLKLSFFLVRADELILRSFDRSVFQTPPLEYDNWTDKMNEECIAKPHTVACARSFATIMVTNKLTLAGNNTVLSKGADSAAASVDVAPTFSLAVYKELASSAEGGHLTIRSIGANYVTPPDAKK